MIAIVIMVCHSPEKDEIHRPGTPPAPDAGDEQPCFLRFLAPLPASPDEF